MKSNSPPPYCTLLVAAAAMLTLPGCSRVPILSGSGSVRIVEPEDFVPDVPAEQALPVGWPEPQLPTRTDQTPLPPVLTVRPGPPAPTPSDAAAVEQPVLVESKIGDINGRPIFATEFLEPIADRLAAEAERMPPDRWETFAKEQIERRLDVIISDELLRAEALARLSPEQKQGFRAFLESMRGDLARGARGSRTLAERRLKQEEGITEEDFIRRREQEALVRNTLLREIDSRVNISWRDIRQRYQRDWKIYNPDPSVLLRLIRVPTADQQAVKAITDALNAGQPFEEVAASSPSNYKPEDAGLDQFTLEGPYEQAEFYGSDILNEKARSLSPGQWTGPFELGTQTAWLKLEAITTESTSIYDAQLAIYAQLLTERRNEEFRRFLKRLEQRASFTATQTMRDRLFEIAKTRFASNTPAEPTP
ncbi:MAG: hypothetical protein D6695_05550 [Planctomycetota bacterium]|nr:MAG: hypothetical protein D6695_05550 [Planctomycetota bacterium]